MNYNAAAQTKYRASWKGKAAEARSNARTGKARRERYLSSPHGALQAVLSNIKGNAKRRGNG